MLTDSFFLNVIRIHIAHEFTIDRSHRCEYPCGRGMYGLVYAIGGRAEYRFRGGARVTVTAGDTLFLSPLAAYSIITENDFRHYTVNFDINEDTSRSDVLKAPYSLLKDLKTESIEHGFKKLADTWREKGDGYEMKATGELYILLSYFYRYFVKSNESENDRLTPVKEYVERNFGSQMTLVSLSQLANMSVTNFRREWKKRFSSTPLRYRDEIRLRYAREYLSCGYYTVSETAEKCGFDDVSYFVRFYKKKTGTTPGESKKAIFK